MDDRIISEFNESMLQIQRLHNHWLDFDKFVKRGNFLPARWELDSVESELYWDAKRMDRDEELGFVKQLNDINLLIQSAYNRGFVKLVYTLLRNKERLLREIQQESGKGSRYKSEEEDSML